MVALSKGLFVLLTQGGSSSPLLRLHAAQLQWSCRRDLSSQNRWSHGLRPRKLLGELARLCARNDGRCQYEFSARGIGPDAEAPHLRFLTTLHTDMADTSDKLDARGGDIT